MNVLLIHRIKRQEEEEIMQDAGNMRDSMMHCSSSQFFHYLFEIMEDKLYYEKFKTTNISEIFASFQSEDGSTIQPKLVLINGAPGMGKTTLCKEITFLWANGKLLKDTKIAFLVFLRDPAIHRIHDLKDFVHYFYKFDPTYLTFSQQCAEILTKRDNSDIMILMDGYDELGDKANNIVIKNLIQRNVLSQCKLVITSRTIASEKLQGVADVRVEVLGFTEQSKMEYIQKGFKDDPNKIKGLLLYLDNHSDIKQICYVPIMMTILVCTYKERKELPTNQSELFECFVTSIISRYLLKLNEKIPMAILSLDDLPDRPKKYFQQLSEFAFKAIENDKLIFTDRDIESLSPNLVAPTKKFYGLGLFKATEHLNMKKIDNCVWYNFLHLSIHEFLAAYYLKSLNISEQFKILENTFFIKRFFNVWVIFVGLQRKATFDFHQFLTYGHINWVSDVAKDQTTILQDFYLLNFSEIKNVSIKDIKGTFQFLCCKNNKSSLQTEKAYGSFIEEFDSWCLLPFKFTWTKLFASLCSTDSYDQLVEVYLLDKSMQDIAYHQIVTELKHNLNLSVMLVSSNTLIGYRINYHQLTKCLSMNASLGCVILRYCLINNDVANILSSYFINTHFPQYLCITDCRNDKPALLPVLQTLIKTSKLKVLDLHGNNITGQMVEDLANVIKNNPDLEELCLSYNDLKASLIKILQELKSNSKVKKLLLNNNNMTEQVAEHLANVIKNNSNLEHLSLRNNKLGTSAIMILQALKHITKLKVLHLDGNNMTELVVEDVAHVIKNNPNLHQLGLANNLLGPSAVVIFQALKENCKLKNLYVHNNNMTRKVGEDLANAIKNNPSLEEIFLSNNNLKSSASMILQALKQTSKLKVLEFSGNNITGQVAEDLADVIRKNSNLEQLNLENNKLGPSAVIVLEALMQNSKLKSLNLNSNNMTSKVVEYLANVIKSNCYLNRLGLAYNMLGPSSAVIFQALKATHKLKTLYLHNNYMTGHVAVDLANVIKNNLDLETVSLSCNSLKSSASVILKALKENCKLKILDLSGNNMTGQIVEDLAYIVKNNPNLEQFYSKNNELGQSALVLLQALAENCTLKRLNLNGNSMTGHVAEVLADIIINNPGLEELCLSDNDLKISVAVILQTLKQNSKLRILDLNGNGMTGQIAEHLANVIKNNSSLERLGLRSNRLKRSAGMILQSLIGNSKLKILNLNGNSMTGHIANDLVSVIKNNPGLEKIYLSDNDLKSSAVAILKALKDNTQLKILSFTNNWMSSNFDTDMALVSVIKNNPLLTELWLGDNMLQSGLINIAISCGELMNLKVMELSCNSINPAEAVYLASVITSISQLQVLMFNSVVLNPKERFHLGVLQFYEASKQILEPPSSNRCNKEMLEIIYLEMWRLLFSDRIKFCYDIINYFPTDLIATQVIHFYNEQNFSTQLLSIARQSEQKLSKLNATNMIICLFNTIKTLKVLDLGYSNINKEAAVELAKAINCNNILEQLWLRSNALDTDGTALILTSLQNISTLRVLDLSYNNIDSVSANGIAAVVSSNPFLEQLWLDGNKLMTSDVAVISSVLMKHSNLRLLSLSSNLITEDIGEELSAIMSSNSLLAGLFLSNNQLKSISMYENNKSLDRIKLLHILELSNNCINGTELAITLSTYDCLKELYLGNNNLGTTGVIKICQALKNTPLLQVLSFNSNKIKSEATNEICTVITTNTNLAILLLSDNDFQTSGILQIANTVKNENPNMQVLSLDDNNVDDQVKEEIKIMLCGQYDLELLV